MKNPKLNPVYKITLITFFTALTLLLLIEGVHFLFTYRAVTRVSSFGVRFLVTGEVYQEVCLEDHIYSEAAHKITNELGINNVSIIDDTGGISVAITPQSLLEFDIDDGEQDCHLDYYGLKFRSKDDFFSTSAALIDVGRYHSVFKAFEYAYDSWVDPQIMKFTVCSNSPGIIYQQNIHTCQPGDDPGRYNSGDKVVVYVRYPYAVGSSLGLDIFTIWIESERWGIIEQFR